MSRFSEFKKKKLLFIFKVFFDIDGSGSINDTDFDLALQKVVQIRGYPKSDPKYSETEKILQNIWKDLRASGDGNKDGEISSDEWCTMWHEYAENPDKPQKWQSQYMDFIFDLQDSTGDGMIDENEFVTVCTSYGIGAAESKEAFAKFSENNSIAITRAEFAKLWKEFFTSDDVNARGNFIFGKTNFGTCHIDAGVREPAQLVTCGLSVSVHLNRNRLRISNESSRDFGQYRGRYIDGVTEDLDDINERGNHESSNNQVRHVWKPDLYKLQLEAPCPKAVVPAQSLPIKQDSGNFCDNEYHGTLSVVGAMKLLQEEGQYLVRKSLNNNHNFFILSLRFNNKVHNYKLFYESGQFYVEEKKLFSRVYDLVAHGLVTLYIEQNAGSYINVMHGLCSYENSPHVTLNRMKRRVTRPAIVEQVESIINEEYEKSHVFRIHTFKGLNWCEFCGNFLWGFTAQGVKCEDCGFSAHNKCSEKVPNDCCPDLKHIRGVFGIDLTTLVKAHRTSRPFIIDKCIQEIEKRGLCVEGLYRVSGFSEEVDALKLVFDKEGEKADISPAAYDSVHVITGILKLYLRLLPLPLITYETHPALIKALQHSTENEQIAALKDALTLLPPAHYNTLKYLIEHLSKVVALHEKTKMTAFNMARVFSPTLMPMPDLNNGIPSMTSEITVLEKMIIHCKSIFS